MSLDKYEENLAPKLKVPKFVKDLTAGVISGALGNFVGYPLDTIRIRMQLYDSKSILGIMRGIVANEGVKGLFKGVVSPVVGRAPVCGITLAANDFWLRRLKNHSMSEDMKGIIAGVFAGAWASPVTCPVEHLKVRKQAYSKGTITYMKLIKKDRLSGLYRSMLPTLGRDIPGYGMFFASYGYFMRLFGVDKISVEENKAQFYFYSVMAGGFAGQLSWIIGYPYDSVKSFMHYHPRHRKVIPTFIYIIKKYGYKRLFNGITPCLLRAFPTNSIVFAVYEWVNNCFARMDRKE